MNIRIVGAILRKDVRSLYPLVLLATALFAGDVFIVRLELIPVWYMFQFPVLLLVGTVVILAVFQSDPAVSLVDDWLCRPVPRAELLAAKLILLLTVFYLSRVVATLVLDPFLAASFGETLQEAFLLQDAFAVFILPVLMFTALVTRSIVQGLGVLIAFFICAFAIPTPFVSAPGPLEPAIGDALLFSGYGWLTYIPATLIHLCVFAFGCWLMYWRRRTTAARVVLGLTVLLTLLLVLAPMWLLPWKAVNAAQTALARADATSDNSAIYLRHWRACFPATRVRDLASNPAFTAARQAAGVRDWTYEDQLETGPDSIAFLTSIELRRLPPDRRVKLAYVEAQYYSAGNTVPLYSLRPTTYNVDSDGSSLSHAWVLPDTAVRQLSVAPQVELKLRYHLALLEPHDFSLPVDGRRHGVPKIGYCSARLDATGGHIDVDCFAGLNEPAQVSAELEEIPASRVYGSPNFAPRWTRWPFGVRLDLTIGSPRLAKHDHVTVTAWTLADYLDESLVLPGILGNDAATCPLPGAESRHFQQAIWRDSAPHEASSISVDEGVQLEVLDFGGQGSPVVLLPGLGATAHSYDALAPMLARKHRVIAITRRGTGYSTRPDFGFDTARLAQDVLQVMDALDLKRVLLVGHSIAGDELTWLGSHHPERFNGLVYLDAAYDRSGEFSKNSRLRELHASLPPEPPLPPQALRNYEAMSKLLVERGHVRLPEGELIAFHSLDKPFLAGTPAIDARTQQAIVAGIGPPDYPAVKIPALAVYAFIDPNAPFPPWYDVNDGELMSKLTEIGRINDDMRRRNIEQFRTGVEKGQVLELQNATHYLIQSNQQQVVEAIEAFSKEIENR